jgi:hypothetical protein
VLWEH